MQFTVVIAIVLIIVALNVAATFRIFTDDYLNVFQRKALTIFVWFVPIMGAMFVYYFRNDDEDLMTKDDGLSGFEVVDPEMPSLYDEASPGHGHD